MPRAPLSLLAALALAACNGPTPARPAPTKTAAPPAKAPTDAKAEPAKSPPAKPQPAPASHPLCDAAAAQLAALQDQASDVPLAYAGSPAQKWVQASDAELGRKDDADIVASLVNTAPAGFYSTKALIEAALAQWMRARLKTAAEGKDGRDAAWAAAACTWRVALRPLAASVAATDPGLADEVDQAFTAGAAAFAAGDPDRVVLPARQLVEKTWYRLAQRRLLAAARQAHEGDPAAASRARATFEALRDRMQDKNTPGIAVVVATLDAPNPKNVDPDKVEREIAVALVKRARKYCSEAVDPAFGKPLGSPAALATVAEGLTYTRLLLPDMSERLKAEAFDEAAHLQTWQAYQEAVEHGDAADAKSHSEQLVQWNCAYQRALGIRECTSTVDEVAP